MNRFRRDVARIVKLGGLMLASAVLIPITMISLGLLFGPKGYEGVVATPLLVCAAWAAILFFGRSRRASPKKISRARLAALPASVAELLQRYRELPREAAGTRESLLEQLAQLEPTVGMLAEDHPAARRLKRLLAHDLTGLLVNFQRLPLHLREEPLHGGPSPRSQLAAGLSAIDRELRRVREEIAQDDLFQLASKQRYLEMKYGVQSDDEKAK